MAGDPTVAPDAMRRFRRWAAITVALVSLGYLAYAVWRGLTETATELASFRWSLYGPVLLLTLVNYGLRFAKWHYYLGRLGVVISVRTNLGIFLTGLAMVISPAKAGEVVKPYLVRVCTGAPITRTLPALVAERGTDGLAVVILAAIGVTTFYAQATEMIFGTIAAVLALVTALSIRPLVKGGIEAVGRLPRMSGLATKLDESYDATRVCLAPVPFAITMALSLVAWFAECLGYWLIFRGLDIDAGLDAATFLYAFATVFGAPAPGGAGMADAALAAGAEEMFAISAGQAIAATLLVRVATLWFGVLLGAFALLRMEAVIADSDVRTASNGAGSDGGAGAGGEGTGG